MKILSDFAKLHWDIFTDDGFTLENVDISMLDSIKSSIDSLNEMDGIEIDYSSFEKLAAILTDVNSKEEDVQAGFNSLTDSILTNTDVLGSLNEETASVITTMLEQMGVTNAQEIVTTILTDKTNELALSKLYLAETGKEIANASEDEVTAFILEELAADNCGQALALLQLKKLLLNGTSISTASDVEEIYNLAVMSGIETEKLTMLAKAKDILNRVESGAFVSNEDMSFMVNVVENADDILSDYQPEVDFSGLSNSAKSAGKETGKTYKEALQDELSDLDNVISYVNSVIDNQVDLLNSQKEAAINALEEEKKAAEEALEAQKKLIQEQIDAKQKEIDAIKAAREERQSELDLQKKIYEFNRLMNQKTQFIFDGKQMVYRNDTSGARNAREEVEEAKENIKISKMEKELSSLELLIDSLDAKIDESNEYYDKLILQTESYWDSLINGLEEYKSRWEQLKEIEEQAEMEAALEKLGISTQDLLNMSEESFNSFKEKYLGILTELYSGNNEMLSAISDAASSNADSLNSYIDKTQGYLNTLGDTDLTNVTNSVKEVTGTLSSAVSELNNTSLSNVISQFNLLQKAISAAAGSISGVSAKPTATDAAGGNPKNPNQTGGSFSLSDALQKHGDVVASVLGTESDGEIGKFNKLENTISKTAQTIGVRDIKTGEAREDTLTGSLQSHSKVAEQIIPAETELFSALEKVVGQAHDHIADIQTMLEDMDGKTFEVTLNINGGTGEALTYSTIGINKFTTDEKDPPEHTQIQKGTPEKFVPIGLETALKSLKADEIADNISKWAELNSNNIIPASLKLNIPDYSNLLSNTNNRNDNSVSVGQINVTCPGVTSKEVAKQVGTALQQEFQGFALNAYQRSHKR